MRHRNGLFTKYTLTRFIPYGYLLLEGSSEIVVAHGEKQHGFTQSGRGPVTLAGEGGTGCTRLHRVHAAWWSGAQV